MFELRLIFVKCDVEHETTRRHWIEMAALPGVF